MHQQLEAGLIIFYTALYITSSLYYCIIIGALDLMDVLYVINFTFSVQLSVDSIVL